MTWKHACFRALAKRKRIILLCLAGLCAALLVYWPHEITYGLYSMKRRVDVRRAMNTYGCRYEVRGPLTIVQVEVEVFGRPLNSGDMAGLLARDSFAKAWNEFTNSYEAGDEFYFFQSDKRSWEKLAGSRGYVRMRKNTVVSHIVTRMN